MSEENKSITFLIGGRTTGKTAIAEEIARKAEARGMKVVRFKAPVSDSITSNAHTPSPRPTMPPELISALRTEQLSQVGRPKWWEIHLWFTTFKKP